MARSTGARAEMSIAVVDLHPREHGPPGPSVADAVAAVQQQIREHFAPLWGCSASLTLIESPTLGAKRLAARLARHAGVVYVSPDLAWSPVASLRDKRMTTAVAFHYQNHGGVPCGFVYPSVASDTQLPWSVLLSHEILEMIVDPHLNLLVGGPHPVRPRDVVLVAYEVCDPVQSSAYAIGRVKVANFVTPAYFMPHRDRRKAARTNYANEKLKPFGTLRGGYLRYFDPARARWETFPEPAARPKGWALARSRTGIAPRGLRREGPPGTLARGWPALACACANLMPPPCW